MFNRYILLGATDRINYGDNLFPVLIKHFLEIHAGSDVQVRNYGILSSDLTSYGGLPTEPINKMYNDPFTDNARVIIVGGEVLGGSWSGIYQYCNPSFYSIYNTRIGKKFIRDKWVRNYLGGKGDYPFIPTSDMFKHDVSIAFNAVGGGRNVKVARQIVPLLEKAAYKSFRDQDTFSYMTGQGLGDAVFTPDSAILMSQVFHNDFLKGSVDKTVNKYVAGAPYIFFQVGNYKGGEETELLVKQLTRILHETDFRVCLCPIGRAAGHDDQVALRKINERFLGTEYADRVTFFAEPSMWDTMMLIKESSCYLGTSLHGIITAQSFKKPYLLINRSVKKGVEYMKSWGISESVRTDSALEQFAEVFLSISLPEARQEISLKSDEQFLLADENMRAVLGL